MLHSSLHIVTHPRDAPCYIHPHMTCDGVYSLPSKCPLICDALSFTLHVLAHPCPIFLPQFFNLSCRLSTLPSLPLPSLCSAFYSTPFASLLSPAFTRPLLALSLSPPNPYMSSVCLYLSPLPVLPIKLHTHARFPLYICITHSECLRAQT
jgi:hypothetical protein